MKLHHTVILSLPVIALLIGIVPAYALTIDQNGGACSSVGTWDSGSDTCTLTNDVPDGIVINYSYVTLDGNGYTVSGSQYGIKIDGRYDIIVKNTNIQNGISITNSKNIEIIKNTISKSNGNAISITSSDTIKISDNTINNSGTGMWLERGLQNIKISNNQISNNEYGIIVYSGQNIEISNNQISNNGYGIYSNYYGYATIRENTVSNNRLDGLRDISGIITKNIISNNEGSGIVSASRQSVISQNIISGNKEYGIVGTSSGGSSVFENLIESNGGGLKTVDNAYNNNLINNGPSYSVSSGQSGNYWSDYSSRCTDSNYDNICDKPYPLGSSSNVYDNYVWKVKSGWLTKFTTPNTIILDAADSNGTTYTYTASATSQDKPLSVTCNPASGSVFPVGKTEVVCAAENGIYGKFIVTVNAPKPVTSPTAPSYPQIPQQPTSEQIIEMAKGTASNTNCGDQCFIPNTISVAVGGKVTWKNVDSAAHTATATDGSFDTSLVNAGASASNTFNTAGTYSYMCILHPWMKGSIMVGNGASQQSASNTQSQIMQCSSGYVLKNGMCVQETRYDQQQTADYERQKNDLAKEKMRIEQEKIRIEQEKAILAAEKLKEDTKKKQEVENKKIEFEKKLAEQKTKEQKAFEKAKQAKSKSSQGYKGNVDTESGKTGKNTLEEALKLQRKLAQGYKENVG